jgi:hypothetical protein
MSENENPVVSLGDGKVIGHLDEDGLVVVTDPEVTAMLGSGYIPGWSAEGLSDEEGNDGLTDSERAYYANKYSENMNKSVSPEAIKAAEEKFGHDL